MPTATDNAQPATRPAGSTTERSTEGTTIKRPTTLAPLANEPTVRGQPSKTKAKKRRKKRAARPARSEPAAASTPQPKQPAAKPVKDPKIQQAPGAQESKAQEKKDISHSNPHNLGPGHQICHPGFYRDPDKYPGRLHPRPGYYYSSYDWNRLPIVGTFQLRILYWNSGGIRGHIRELTALAQLQDIHVILLGETRLSEEVELRIPNYFAYRRDEVSLRGYPYRGTAALVRRDIVHEELEQTPFASLRTQGVRMCAEDEELSLYAAYKPPQEAFSSSDVQPLISSQKPTLVVGDLNANHPAWGSRVITPAGRCLLEDSVRLSYGIMGPGAPTHIPTDPRRQTDVLDIALHHGITYPMDVEVVYDFDTQHLPILVTLTLRRGFTVPRSPRPRVELERYTSQLMGFELTAPISISHSLSEGEA
ncbi:unnamed protein product [Euphydryas editha]|uniref:Endonuclease/exonuclease/phosphatase domain-containing protein n=1 Tax=Euphydryas editha TaxID=104508 RepID=A0AAU9TXT5_EUPED|nr:unnamed protein product [Euphydryas editha]